MSAGGREVARAAQAQGFRAQALDNIIDAQRLNLCRIAVRSQLKRDIKLGKVLAVCLAPPSGATLMRAQRVALSLFAFCANEGVPTAHVQSCAFLLWQAPTCHLLLQSRRHSDVQLDLCQLGHKNRRPTRILLANVDPCDTQKLRRACHGVNFTCSRSGSTHHKTSEPIPSGLTAEFCHSSVQALMAEPHARFFMQSAHSFGPPMRTIQLR